MITFHKIDLNDDRNIDNGGHLSSNNKLPLNNDNDNMLPSDCSNLMKIKKMKDNSTQYDHKYFSSFFHVSKMFPIKSDFKYI